jgi:hypothetical protein
MTGGAPISKIPTQRDNEAAQGSVQKAWSLTIRAAAEVMLICEESKSVRKAMVAVE